MRDGNLTSTRERKDGDHPARNPPATRMARIALFEVVPEFSRENSPSQNFGSKQFGEQMGPIAAPGQPAPRGSPRHRFGPADAVAGIVQYRPLILRIWDPRVPEGAA
jgi:hypothetical protein